MKKQIKNILLVMLGVVLGLTLGVSAATITSTSVTYGDITVKTALDELIEKTTPLSSKVSIGDYVSMTPTSTSYTVPMTLTGYDSDQTINPSELNLWRVIDIRNDGTIEVVSEYASSVKIKFKGQIGYLNLVGVLNLIAEQYENRKYTVSSRYIGYNGQTEFITDKSKFTETAPWTSSTINNSNETLGGGDVMYEYDTNASTGLVYKALGTLVANNPSGISMPYWLATRYYYYGSENSYLWRGCYVSTNASLVTVNLSTYNIEWNGNVYGYALRPIVTLRADITSYTGSGTSASPWILS